MKVPEHEFRATVAFYRDVLGFTEVAVQDPGGSVAFEFGDRRLWIDRVENLSQSELWLEIETDDLAAADAHLRAAGCARRDGIEPLPEGFRGFWISAPANIIHLVCGEGA